MSLFGIHILYSNLLTAFFNENTKHDIIDLNSVKENKYEKSMQISFLVLDLGLSSFRDQVLYRHREQICGCQGGWGVGEGWSGSLGLAGANYYIYV